MRFPITTLLLLLTLSGCASYPRDRISETVTGDLPGARKIGRCKEYADALFARLKALHVGCRLIYFGYCGRGVSGAHAIVGYRDGDSFWLADNAFPYPIRADGTSPQEWIDQECALDEFADPTFTAWPVRIVSSNLEPVK